MTGSADSDGAGGRRLDGPALLFCPADRPDRYAKALAAADLVILDLEDAVAPDRKDAARAALQSSELPTSRVVVRLNEIGGPEFAADLESLRHTDYRVLMVPKAEDPARLDALVGYQLIALCETPAGVLRASDLARHPDVIALFWGAEDLTAAMGGRSSRWADGRYRDAPTYARAQVLLAAKAAGCQAIDSVYLDIPDLAGLAVESEDAAASGFGLKACIHPSQVAVVRNAFRPSDAALLWARRVLEAAESGGVASLDGQMIDGPLIRQAEATIRAAAGGHADPDG